MDQTQIDISFLPIPVLVLGPDLELVGASRAAYPVFGLGPYLATHSDGRARLESQLNRHQDLLRQIGEISLRCRHPGSGDRFRWDSGDRVYQIKVCAYPTAGGECGFHASLVDMTESSLHSDSLEFARTFLERILDNLPLGIMVTDADLNITHANRAQLEIMQRLGQEHALTTLIGMNLEVLCSDEFAMPWTHVRRLVVAEAETLHGGTRLQTPDGTEVALDITVAPLGTRDDTLQGAVRICQDVTDKVQMMNELREAAVLNARLETVRELAVTTNHKINNCLTTILLHAQLLRRHESAGNGDVQELVDGILAETERIAEFAKSLRELRELKTVSYLAGGEESMLDLGP
jgi:PAS domain S-box-containing protein